MSETEKQWRQGEFRPGEQVHVTPNSSWWSHGIRSGVVVAPINRNYYTVRFDIADDHIRVYRVHARDLVKWPPPVAE